MHVYLLHIHTAVYMLVLISTITVLDWTTYTGLPPKLKIQHYSIILGITNAITWDITYPKTIIDMHATWSLYIFINFECLSYGTQALKGSLRMTQ